MTYMELNPYEPLILVRQDGYRLKARFLFIDTTRAAFHVWPAGAAEFELREFRDFQLMPDGTLRDVPTKEQLMNAAIAAGDSNHFGSPATRDRALARCKRWDIVAA